jgi:PKD repeat protein
VPARNNYSASGLLSSSIYSVADGAHALSNQIANQNGNTNINNNTFVLLEPISLAGSDEELTSYIGDSGNSSLGDFNTLAYSVENVTSNTFAAPAVSDFYQSVPNSSSSFGPFVDPITGTTNGPAYWVGYFTLNVNGSMTFTRASSVAPPSAGGVTSSGTNGFSPLKVIFTNSASGNITNWVWNFGNGTSITNTTGGPVTNTYAAAGNYTVTLTVYGPGGSSTVTLGNYIVISATPQIKAYLAAGKFVLTGTNLPSAVQYRILNTTNLSQSVGGWQPVLTNTFLANGTFWYTNSATNLSGFFRLVSP